MNKPLNQAHLLFLLQKPLDLPKLVTDRIGDITTIISRKHRFFNFFRHFYLNWRIRNLHATKPIQAIITDRPEFISDSLRNFAKKFNLPIIADNLAGNFNLNIITRQAFHGFLLGSLFINGDKPSLPVEAGTAVVPLALAQSHYWKLAGYKSQILHLAVIAINANSTEQTKLSLALDVIKSLDPDITIDLISASDQDPTPLTKRLRKAHLIINIGSDSVWLETSAVAVAAGIPLISPKRRFHGYVPPKFFPGYIIADWQVDTLTTIIQNSIIHPEETYRIAKNAQHWLKTNLGTTFLPLAWVSGLDQLLTADP